VDPSRNFDESLTNQSEFINRNVRNWQLTNPLIEYKFVDQIPTDEPECVNHHRSSKDFQGACTSKFRTYILAAAFRKMTLREQAKTIIHERLHALGTNGLSPSLFHEYVDDITEALDLAMNLYNLQWRGKRPRLGKRNVEKLQTLVRRIAQIGLDSTRKDKTTNRGFLDTMVVTPYGGGLVSRESHWYEKGLHHVYVGVGGILGFGTIISPDYYFKVGKNFDYSIPFNAEIIDTSCYYPRPTLDNPCNIAPNSKIQYVTFLSSKRSDSISVGEFAVARNVTLQDLYGDVSVKRGAILENAQFVWLTSVTLNDGAVLKNIGFKQGTLGKHSVLLETNSYVDGNGNTYDLFGEGETDLVFAEGVRIEKPPKCDDYTHLRNDKLIVSGPQDLATNCSKDQF
jgi:hypothetical protein